MQMYLNAVWVLQMCVIVYWTRIKTLRITTNIYIISITLNWTMGLQYCVLCSSTTVMHYKQYLFTTSIIYVSKFPSLLQYHTARNLIKKRYALENSMRFGEMHSGILIFWYANAKTPPVPVTLVQNLLISKDCVTSTFCIVHEAV